MILVSHDGFNQSDSWRSLIVVPVSTSPRQMRRGPTTVLLPAGVGGLPRASVALCHQVTTLDRGKIEPEVGILPQDLLVEIERGLLVALGMR